MDWDNEDPLKTTYGVKRARASSGEEGPEHRADSSNGAPKREGGKGDEGHKGKGKEKKQRQGQKAPWVQTE